MLTKLQNFGYDIGFLTNSPRRHGKIVIQHLFGDDFLESVQKKIVGVDDLPRGICKPNPEAFKAALQKLGWGEADERIIFLDDSAKNLNGALNAGVGGVGRIYNGAHDDKDVHHSQTLEDLLQPILQVHWAHNNTRLRA